MRGLRPVQRRQIRKATFVTSPLTPDFWKKFWSKVRFTETCWLWTTESGIPWTDYGRIQFECQDYRAPTLSYEYFYGRAPEGLEICHRCDNPPCVNPEHLFVGTHAQNIADAVAKGRALRGSRNGKTNLTEDDVLTIRALHVERVSGCAIARWYGVDPTTIYKILWRKRWGHVD